MTTPQPIPATAPAQSHSSNNIAALTTMLAAPSVQRQFENALKDHKDTFIASIVDLASADKALRTCEPKAIIAECLKAAVLQLPINKALGFAYVVVYNNNKKDERGNWVKVPTPTFILGYKGYIQMAMRTGQYRTINADVVYEGELRRVDKLTGSIDFDGQRTSDRVVGYFAHFELLNGFRKTLYMTVEEMAAYAKRYSPSVGRNTTIEQLAVKAQDTTAGKAVGWEGNFGDMALKTCVRRLLSKYGYLSIEMQNSLAAEEKLDADASRSEVVEATATKTVNLDEAEYEEVDPTTGEITATTAPTAQAAQATQATPTAQATQAATEELPY